MWWLVLILLAIYFTVHKAGYTDEVTVSKIVRNLKKVFPTMEPLNTTSIDNQTARITFLDTATYAGSVVDAGVDGVIPRAPPDLSIQPYTDGAYKSYNEITA
jgi:hypothetical protein